MKIKLFTAIMLFASQAVHAFSPTTGLWWNPNESGRGYVIDIQDDVMTLSIYAYDHSQQPLWYLGAATYDHASNTFTANMSTYDGGQCLGCPPSSVSPIAAGSMRIVFTDLDRGTLYFPGGSTSIEHFYYGFASKQDFLLGGWSFTQDTLGLITTQWIDFTSHYTASDGTLYVAGIMDNDSNSAALGQYSSSLGAFVVGIIDSSRYTHFYTLRGDDRRMFGQGEIVAPNASPTGNGVPAVGSRLLYLSELLPAKKNSKLDHSTLDELATSLERATRAARP